MQIRSITPVLRMFDETKAREYYVGFLGFRVDWEHRFELDLPLYMQVSRAGCVLHLSEHHGDGCPGARLRLEITDGLEAFQRELMAKEYGYSRPGIESTPWKTREMTLLDPFGNQLVFYESNL